MAQQQFIPYARQSITSEDIAEVGRVLAGEMITRGPLVQEFEAALAHYCGAQYAVLLNSGTTALQAACHAAQVSPSDRVLTTPNSFVATATAAVREGASPVFVDIDPKTGNLDLDRLAPNLEQSLSRGRSVVMPVHYGGVPVDMRTMEALIRDPETVVIEDAAAALGSRYDKETRVGSCRWSQMTVFSFHPAKLITTGEGGAVTTNDPDLYHRLCRFRNNGIERDLQRMTRQDRPWYYEVQETTGNYNFTDFQAALGLSQLRRIDQLIEKRRTVAQWYRERLPAISHLRMIPAADDGRVSLQLLVALIDFAACGTSRGEVMRALEKQGVGTQVHYLPIYSHPYFRRVCGGDLASYFPGMEQFYSQALTLPLYFQLEEGQVERVCKALAGALSGF